MKKIGYDAKSCYVGFVNGRKMSFPTEEEYDEYLDEQEDEEIDENDVDNTLNEC